MSNRRIVEQLILRLKCAPSIAPVRAQLATDLPAWLRRTLQDNVGSAPTQWGHRYDLTAAQQVVVCDLGALRGLGDAQRCILYQHRSVPSDERLLENALPLAINSSAWPSGEFGEDWGSTTPAWQLTPTMILYRWPTWMIGLLYLIALSRHEWVFVALYGRRTDAPDWREILGDAWFNTNEGRLTPAVKQAVEQLESIAFDLQAAHHLALRPGGSVSGTFASRGLLAASLPGTLTFPAFIACVSDWLKSEAVPGPSSLGRALDGLNLRLNPGVNPPPAAQIEAALCALLDLSRVTRSSYSPAVALNAWLARIPPHESPSAIVARILLLAAFLASADAVLSRDGLKMCLVQKYGSQPQYADVIDGLFRGESITEMTKSLASLLGKAPIPAAWVPEAIDRGGDWLAAPPPRWVSPTGWDFKPEQADGLTAEDVTLAIDWLGGPRNVPSTASAVWSAVCNLFLSCCLEEIVCGMQDCYRQARQRGIGT